MGRKYLALTTCGVLLSRLAGAVKELAVSRSLGTSEEAGLFSSGFALFMYPVSVWGAVFLTYSTVQDKKEDEVLGLAAAAGIISAILLIPLCRVSHMCTAHILLLCPGIAFAFISIGQSGILMRKGRATGSIFEFVPTAALILCSAVFPHNAAALLFSLSAGYFLYTALLFSTERLPLPSLPSRETAREFLRSFYVLGAGYLLSASLPVLDQAFARAISLETAGKVGYAYRLVTALLSVFTTTLYRFFLPRFAVEENQKEKSSAPLVAAALSLLTLLAFTLPLYLLSPLVSRVFLSSREITELIRIFSFSAPFITLSVVCSCFFLARKNFWIPCLGGLTTAAARTALGLFLNSTSGTDIALGSTLSTALSSVTLLLLLLKTNFTAGEGRKCTETTESEKW